MSAVAGAFLFSVEIYANLLEDQKASWEARKEAQARDHRIFCFHPDEGKQNIHFDKKEKHGSKNFLHWTLPEMKYLQCEAYSVVYIMSNLQGSFDFIFILWKNNICTIPSFIQSYIYTEGRAISITTS